MTTEYFVICESSPNLFGKELQKMEIFVCHNCKINKDLHLLLSIFSRSLDH